ncbi:MAG TPA: Uma2 family endonuclease [Gemmataceae bacterium]|jgi:Uma2 family endonuclease
MTATLAPPRLNMDPAIANLETVAELLERLGGIPPERVRWKPCPGTATEQDLIAIVDGPERRLCELVDGTLVEKAVGFIDDRLGSILLHFLEDYLEEHNLGFCVGAQAMMRIVPGRVRLPDVSFISWNKLPKRRVPTVPIANLVPDLAVEVLSKSNTRREMKIKREEYFQGGARLVWEINPKKQSARVYTSPNQFQEIGPDGALDGDDVLPGFVLPLKRLFARAERGA